jgi:hypothetical protein
MGVEKRHAIRKKWRNASKKAVSNKKLKLINQNKSKKSKNNSLGSDFWKEFDESKVPTEPKLFSSIFSVTTPISAFSLPYVKTRSLNKSPMLSNVEDDGFHDPSLHHQNSQSYKDDFEPIVSKPVNNGKKPWYNSLVNNYKKRQKTRKHQIHKHKYLHVE